jgi:hypothetical protein
MDASSAHFRRAFTRAWFGLALLPGVLSATDLTPLEQGLRLYREGVLLSGQPLRATASGDTVLAGTQAACVNCHRRSGYGSAEGGRIVPPVAGAMLFRPRRVERPGAAGDEAQPPGSRPAYDVASLRRALRDGIDPTGRELSALMPRYELDDASLDVLAAYLHTLSARAMGGVTESEMHFATIVTEGVTPRQRASLLGVLEAFFRDHNTEFRQETRRGARAVFGHSRAYRAWRKWRLHVWELSGSSDTWRAQLDRYFDTQPVFAVVSGVGQGAWRPVHEFCERVELPCLFPNTDLPSTRNSDFYSIYLSRGLELEATVLADFLRDQPQTPRRIVQVFREDAAGRVATGALRRALDGAPGITLVDRGVAAAARLSPDMWRQIAGQSSADVYVLWLEHEELSVLATANVALPRGEIYLSSSLTGYPGQTIPSSWRSRAHLVHPFELPRIWQAKRTRLAHWLQDHGLELGDERTQANTYLAVNLLGRALKHLREPYSREYLIERLEHIADNAAWSSLYPRLGLGPGQRFASKGGYVIRLAPNGEVATTSGWIVPSL